MEEITPSAGMLRSCGKLGKGARAAEPLFLAQKFRPFYAKGLVVVVGMTLQVFTDVRDMNSLHGEKRFGMSWNC